MAELPAGLRRELPPDAQRAYRAAYREALAAGVPEEGARIMAQEAVEEGFRRAGDRWVPRGPRATSGPPYGEAAIARLVRGARFPCTSGQLLEQTGDPVVEIAEGQPLPLADVLDLLEQGYWHEPIALLEAVHRAWPRVKRRWDEAYSRGLAEKPLSQAQG